ncbi:hypothetical protein ABT115_20185 [Streptomyces sp. NPDC001832]|uniref:hypothetical protein n=1 Tax=Streptomyces sp. NPDC001832 TaxID=3154527 RepID=UPI00332506EE
MSIRREMRHPALARAEERVGNGMNIQGNNGIIAMGGSNAVGNAVASGSNARAEVRDSGQTLAPTDRANPLSPQEISDLLAQLVDELGRSDHPERADLIECAQDAQEEVVAETPRKGKLRVMARNIAESVSDFVALVPLAAAINEAVGEL